MHYLRSRFPSLPFDALVSGDKAEAGCANNSYEETAVSIASMCDRDPCAAARASGSRYATDRAASVSSAYFSTVDASRSLMSLPCERVNEMMASLALAGRLRATSVARRERGEMVARREASEARSSRRVQ